MPLKLTMGIILLFTFRTLVGAFLLAFVIQGSIWINFTFPYVQGLVASFVTDMIVSAIQMGATIDYAIVIMNRYQSLKKEMGRREAMIAAVDEGFATVITSGSILTMAGFMIGLRVSDVYVSHIGLAVGRGAAVSVVLVMTVLPQLILLMDTLIDKIQNELTVFCRLFGTVPVVSDRLIDVLHKTGFLRARHAMDCRHEGL